MPLPGLTVSPGFMEIAPSVVPGSITLSTAGTYDFVIPHYNTLTVELWGGGGGGVGHGPGYVDGSHGGDSTFNGLTAGGGRRGSDRTGGAGGTPSGGDINTPGNPGGNTTIDGSASGAGGNAPNGGTGGASRSGVGNGNSGNSPGGGGAGSFGRVATTNYPGAGGGSGAYVSRTYAPGELTPGAIIPATVGNRGSRGSGSAYDGGYGGYGQIKITWS